MDQNKAMLQGTLIVKMSKTQLESNLLNMDSLILYVVLLLSSVKSFLTTAKNSELICYIHEIFKFPCLQLRELLKLGLICKPGLSNGEKEEIFKFLSQNNKGEYAERLIKTFIKVFTENKFKIDWIKYCFPVEPIQLYSMN